MPGMHKFLSWTMKALSLGLVAWTMVLNYQEWLNYYDPATLVWILAVLCLWGGAAPEKTSDLCSLDLGLGPLFCALVGLVGSGSGFGARFQHAQLERVGNGAIHNAVNAFVYSDFGFAGRTF